MFITHTYNVSPRCSHQGLCESIRSTSDVEKILYIVVSSYSTQLISIDFYKQRRPS